MTRSLFGLVVAGFLFHSWSFAQVPTAPGQGTAAPGAAVPGPQVPGAPRPGLPARDSAQRPQTGTARIRGRVVASGGTSALRRAQLTLTATDNVQFRRSTTTDGEGRYEFAELPGGRYQLTATKAGYVTLQYGQRRPFDSGTPVSLRDGETLAPVDFALPKGAVISVRVTDEFNEPIAGASVQVQRFQWGSDGQRRLTAVAQGNSGPFAGTDDRGEMRIFGLMPGEYILEASTRLLGAPGLQAGGGNAGEGFARTFYPGTTSSAQAQPVVLGIGEEVGVQFAMVTAQLSRIRGTVVDSQGRPASGAGVQLVTLSGGGTSSRGAGTVGPDGAFVLSGVDPGEHTLRFQLRNGAESEAAAVPIVVAGDIDGVSARLSPGATVTGRVVFEGTSPRTGPGGLAVPLRVTMQTVDRDQAPFVLGAASPAEIDADGNFRLTGVSGRFFFNVAMSPAWVLKSVTLDGADITDVPQEVTGTAGLSGVVITMTDRLAAVSGVAADARGQNVSDYVVVIQPGEQKEPAAAARLIRVARPDTNGRFEVRGLRPGRYVATAVEWMEQNRQFSPEFQKELRRGAREFTVKEGESLTLDLRLIPSP